ncbi:MAGa7180 family putative nuclease [Mycoplasmopsis lipofaciens]|uniref:MAGa7180 family putative nuclease n=1 Tax=Mycoplasmopsis lipofaciens TaxID=114884 RepID=UPI0004869F0D|nr:hypothetical protein [Mycoplasmopsis lipofaciens]
MPKRYFNEQDYILDEKKQILKLRPEFHNFLLNNIKNKKGFKKFGGSSIGNILCADEKYKSEFAAFCFMSRLNLPPLQMKYINAGVAIEPKTFEVMKKALPNLDIQHIEAKDVNYDYFPKLEILGGVPDGLIPSKKMVLEMKAVGAKKQEEWEKDKNSGIPNDYKKQAQLYAYLLNYDYYSIVATYLHEEDYKEPQKVNLNERNIGQYVFKVDREKAKDDANKVIAFWKKYSQDGISPKYSLPEDADLVAFLRCKNIDEWKQLFEEWKSIGKVDKDIEFNWW